MTLAERYKKDFKEMSRQPQQPSGGGKYLPEVAAQGITLSNKDLVDRQLQRQTSAPAQPSIETPDSGRGFAIVDGKRINYADIGTSRMPRLGGDGYDMGNGGRQYGSVNVVHFDDSAVERAYQDEVARAQQLEDENRLAGKSWMSRRAARDIISSRLARQGLDQQWKMHQADTAAKNGLTSQKAMLESLQLNETSRHNKAMEGLKKSEIEKTGVDVRDTDMIRNMNYLVQSGVATDAKDAHAILNGKKGGRDDFVSRVVQARIKSYHDNQLLNKDPLDMNQVINEANQAADKLFPNSRQGQSVPAAPQPSAPDQATAPAISPTSAVPSAFDPYVFRPESQGLNDGPYTKNLRELGIKAKRPNIGTFFNSK